MGYLLRYSVVCLCVWGLGGVAGVAEEAAAPRALGAVSPTELPVKVTEDWPADVPCPPGFAKRFATASPNHFAGEVETKIPLAELAVFFRDELDRLGWKRIEDDTRVQQNGNFYMFGSTKGSRTIGVQGSGSHEGGRFTRAYIKISDKDAACRDVVLPDDPEAAALLQRLRDTYASAKSYADTGVAVTSYEALAPQEHVTLPRESKFTTAYVAPNQFRFECGDWYRYVMHREGQTIQRYSSDDGSRKELGSLEDGFGEVYNLAQGGVSTVPRMMGLLIFGSEPMKHPHLIGEEVLEGALCRVIEYSDSQCLPGRVWIAVDDGTLRRIETYDHMCEGIWRHVTTYQPTINLPVPEEQLAFNKAGQLDLPNEPGIVERTARTVVGVFDYWF